MIPLHRRLELLNKGKKGQKDQRGKILAGISYTAEEEVDGDLHEVDDDGVV